MSSGIWVFVAVIIVIAIIAVLVIDVIEWCYGSDDDEYLS